MYIKNDKIGKQPFNKLNVVKLAKTDALEILSISLEKDAIFPEHSSPSDAHLIMLEGDMVFYINDKEFQLKNGQYFSFPKEEKHWVRANENSKFLIIR
ncbi:cupin domain-containing protein [Maribacter algicola]|uniref:Cupin domain-containing protein n=1 Tax=Meishania litoralis TaxID=3434685 RepID=A0ACC7LGE1_9FLAO